MQKNSEYFSIDSKLRIKMSFETDFPLKKKIFFHLFLIEDILEMYFQFFSPARKSSIVKSYDIISFNPIPR